MNLNKIHMSHTHASLAALNNVFFLINSQFTVAFHMSHTNFCLHHMSHINRFLFLSLCLFPVSCFLVGRSKVEGKTGPAVTDPNKKETKNAIKRL